MKRIFTLLLTLVMTFSLAIPAQAANSTKASTMRLMETEGTATVENAIGKKLSIQDKMRLYNGYEVSTEKASYAYISLDNNKAVKLDASSAVKVNQSGKKLELDVTAGELMFNVPVALKSDESLNIRTSTMVTGIRGTAGWVNALDRYTTRVGVLEGSVTIQSKDPFTGADRSVTIVGGQIATIIRHERANAIQQQLIDDGVIIEENIVAELTKPGQIVEEIQEADIPGFVAEEVSSNSDLQDRIAEESPLNVEEIIKDAQQRLNAEEKAADKQEALIEKTLKELAATEPGLPFAEPEVIVQTNTVTNTVTNIVTNTEYVSAVLSNPTTDEVNSLFETLDVIVVTDVDENFNLLDLALEDEDTIYLLGGEFIIDEGTVWEVSSGTIICSGGVEITNYGVLTTSTGVLKINRGAELINHGEIYVVDNGDVSDSLTLNGTLQNFADIMIGDDSHSGHMLIEGKGELYNYSAYRYEEARRSMRGQIYIYGEYLPDLAALTEASEDSTTQTFENSVLTNEGAIYNYAHIDNAGIIENKGFFRNGPEQQGFGERSASIRYDYDSGCTYNYGIINNSGSLKNSYEFYNQGMITATGDENCAFENSGGWLYMNGGTISASGDCCALYNQEGQLYVSDSKIIHHGGGAGWAFSDNGYDSSYYSTSLPLTVPSDCLHNLLPTSREDCIREASCYDYDNDVSFDAICLYNYFEEYSNPYFKAKCFPYTEKRVENGYTTYTISLDRLCYHEGGPC